VRFQSDVPINGGGRALHARVCGQFLRPTQHAPTAP
jgi:hypothetical protein